MSSLQPVRGTRDILGEEARRFRLVTETFRDLAQRYGFAEISTPIFEFTEVFQRTLGETSDVVSKEMYTFTDRGGEGLTLRPEMTAGIARALLSGGLAKDLPLKFFGHGPMFRYERPQKGRLRQFHQIDAEILGVPEPQADIEVIALGWDLLSALGLGDKVTLELNSLGDPESRATYRDVLVGYFRQFEEKLSEDSRARLGKNPLRILDSKDEGDRVLVANAPLLSEHLNERSTTFFADVRRGLDALGVPYTVNQRLVRGLDYYSHTAFEFTTTTLGAQGTVLAGGRYDGLVEQMGGPPTAGIGWASGIERLAMMVEVPAEAVKPIAIIPVGAAAEETALKLAHRLRRAGFTVEHGYRGNVGKRMKRADKLGCAVAILLGDDELAAGEATVRTLADGAQGRVALDHLEQHLQPFK
ncbi:histidine--tRNA ligase [Zavarzinia sp. CC-PAN008]|uniref:histidine--tRNA ligase n=1 Tax=Zavarzinia sp. CC-PAN008 TaxID=3243332 RepID=UPI003F747264